MNTQETIKRAAIDLLDRDKFKEWLETYSSDWPIGHVGIKDACPLATYLWRKLDIVTAAVGDDTIYIKIKHGDPLRELVIIDTPNWAAWFICTIDKYTHGRQVNSVQCLQALGS